MPFNPFENVPISGTWESHASYSAGGTDYPLDYRTPIYAPARGHLYTSGRPPGVNASNEWACGWVGTAGRRSILMLEKPIERPASGSRRLSPPEGNGPMVAIVFQHQAEMSVNSGPNTLYLENGGPIGFSGASANGVDMGGDVHLHWHGLNAAGARLRVEAFLNRSSQSAGDDPTPIEIPTDGSREVYIKVPDGRILHISHGVKVAFTSAQEYANWRNIVTTYKSVTPGATNIIPPDISQVMGVTWDGYTQITQNFGVAT